MGLLKRFFSNTAKPEGLLGKVMADGMNQGHAKVAEWGLGLVDVPEDAHVLDVGCGGGANVARLLERCPRGKVFGLDHSTVSVDVSRKNNQDAVDQGRCKIVLGDVQDAPQIFEPASFDAVTAFETIYFWPEPERCLRRLLDVIKPGGSLYVVNEEAVDVSPARRWERMIDAMHVYEADELVSMLERAGYTQVERHDHVEHNWLCLRGRKAWGKVN